MLNNFKVNKKMIITTHYHYKKKNQFSKKSLLQYEQLNNQNFYSK